MLVQRLYLCYIRRITKYLYSRFQPRFLGLFPRIFLAILKKLKQQKHLTLSDTRPKTLTWNYFPASLFKNPSCILAALGTESLKADYFSSFSRTQLSRARLYNRFLPDYIKNHYLFKICIMFFGSYWVCMCWRSLVSEVNSHWDCCARGVCVSMSK